MDMETKGHCIGDVVKKLNVSPRTIRYYEELGLITAERSQGGFRVFKDSQIEKLKTILALKDVGMSLDEIRNFVHLRHHGETGAKIAPGLIEALKKKVKEIQSTVEKYNIVLKELNQTISIVETCKHCNNTAEETACEKCMDSKTNRNIPPLLKTLL
jgi:DNA-binding transcriptional MerR regulator